MRERKRKGRRVGPGEEKGNGPAKEVLGRGERKKREMGCGPTGLKAR